MKRLSIISFMFSLLFAGFANGADITIYYSPSCPHCHHARDFFSNTLIYEYPMLKVIEVNVTEPDNRQMFLDVLKKCEYTSGGVPVFVIGDKCFQGYVKSMQDDIRTAIEVDLTDVDKVTVTENKKALSENADGFKSAHSDRVHAVTEYTSSTQKKNEISNIDNNTKSNVSGTHINSTNLYWYVLVVALAVLFGIVLFGRKK